LISAAETVKSRPIAAPPKEQMQEQQDHHGALHDVDMQRGARKPTEIEKHHAVAADEQKDDAHPHPREETAEDAVPERKPHRRLKRSHRLAQDHVGEEHAANPDDGGKDMERYEDRHM